MSRNMLLGVLVILMFIGIALFGQSLQAQTSSLPYILPNNNGACPLNCRQIPWKAGSDLWNSGALPAYSPQVTCSAAVGNGTTDNTTALNNCIAAAASGSAVYLPSGNFFINGTVRLKSNIVLRGAGPTTIILEGSNGWLTTQDFSHSTNITPATTYNQIPTTYTLSGAPQKGDTTLTIGSGSVSAGTWIKVFGNDDPALISDPGGTCDYCADDTGAYLMQQIVQVTAINSGGGGAGSVVTISQPLYYTPYTGSVRMTDPAGTEPAGAKYDIISFPTQKAGYEYFHVVATGDIGAGQIITMQGCLFCWVKGVETQFTGSNSGSAHIQLQFSYGNEVRDCYVHEQRSGASGSGYGIYVFFTNGNHKIENNIVRHNRHGIIWEGGGGAEAVLYNYIDDEYTDDLTYLGSARPNHGAHPYMVLWEGNIASHLAPDDFHGSASHFVFFRNNMWGDESNDNGGCSYVTGNDNFGHATCGSVPNFNPGGMSGFDTIDVYTLNTYMSYVANVLGRTGMHVNWSGATLRGFNEYGTNTNPIVYSYAGAVSSVPSTDTTSINHGNYDFKTNGVAYWEGGSNHAFASSWYYSSKPAFLGSKPWPLIGPDITGGNLSGTSGLVNTNTAYDCYWTGGVHANQPFNSAACYGSSTSTKPISPPTGLTAIVN
jgi:parallel beta-helix repeat protein